MQEMSKGSSDHSNCTAFVLLNTRMFRSYQSIKEMVKPKAESPWGNHFAFLHVQLPELVASTGLKSNRICQEISANHQAKEKLLGCPSHCCIH